MSVEEITQIFKVMYLDKRKCDVVGEIKESVTLVNIPENWHLLDGASLTRADYPELWDAAPTFWRASSPDRIVLPDTIRTYTAHGFDGDPTLNYRVGGFLGSNSVTLTVAEMPTHTHNDGFAAGAQAGAGAIIPASPLLGGTPYPLTSTGGGLSHENRPRSFTVYRFIVVSP